jgi:hypothetical protein
MAKSPLTTTAPTGQIAPFGLRMLPELREKIETAARSNGRSMNAEIVSRLEASFAELGGVADVVDFTVHPSPAAFASPEGTLLTQGIKMLVEQLRQQIDAGKTAPEATLTIKIEPSVAEADRRRRGIAKKPKP